MPWHPPVVTFWDELSIEERCVFTAALEEAPLNGVIADFLGHAESGSAVWIFNLRRSQRSLTSNDHRKIIRVRAHAAVRARLTTAASAPSATGWPAPGGLTSPSW